jgi:phosphoserine phosphatase RsbU/P
MKAVEADSTLLLESLSCCTCEDHRREALAIQCSLLPAGMLRDASVEIAFRYSPFAEVGGDFADFFRLPDGHIGLYLGDVVGKGLPGAMYAALVMGTLRGIHKSGQDAASVLALLNQRLLVRPVRGRFCSTAYAVFNPLTRQLLFSNAGLPFPLLVGEAGCRLLGQGGVPSGMFPESSYDQHTAQLSPGDLVLFATDGLHELHNPQGTEFGAAEMEEIWAQCLNRSADEALEMLFNAASIFSDGVQHDDVTAIALKVLPNG